MYRKRNNCGTKVNNKQWILNLWGGDGAEVIYALRNNSVLSSKIAKELENAGQNVRKYYQRRLPSNPAKDYYYILRDTPNNETIIVEYGFADSTGDDVEQLKNNWEKYGRITLVYHTYLLVIQIIISFLKEILCGV